MLLLLLFLPLGSDGNSVKNLGEGNWDKIQNPVESVKVIN